MEAGADLWAADTLFDMGLARTVVTPGLFGFLVLSTGLDPEVEKSSSHPLGLRRMVDVLEHIQNRQRLIGPAPDGFDEIVSDARQLLARAEKEYGELHNDNPLPSK